MKTLLTLLLLTSINIAYAQTCYSDITNNTPDNRYTNNNNGTITDNRTKLVWKQCSEGQTWTNGSPDSCIGTVGTMNWQAALTLADSATFTNKANWQLPNIKQLRSITSDNCFNPGINQTHFPSTSHNYFWSSTPNASDSSKTWIINFENGDDFYYNRYASYHVRLVRPVE